MKCGYSCCFMTLLLLSALAMLPQSVQASTINSNTRIEMDIDIDLSKTTPLTKLLSQSRSLANNNNDDGDDYNNAYAYSHITSYSIQFQGCHHIQQWNDEADDDSDVKLQTKRLVRYRLVPTEKCSVVSPWASSKVIRDAARFFGTVDYGEYIVDLNTFVGAYLEAKMEENYYDDDDGNNNNGGGDDNDGNNGGSGLDIYDYANCAQLDWQGADDDDGNNNNNNNYYNQYYFGPSCTDQGGEIRMNLFTDDTCTTMAQCGNNGKTRGAKCYTRSTGYILPGTKESIIEEPCLACTQNYNLLNSGGNGNSNSGENGTTDDAYLDNFDYGNEPREVCSTLYDLSGKCERNMKSDDGSGTHYNYACKYLEGIQIGVSKQGFALAVRRSIFADAVLFLLAAGTIFMGLYISYMKTLLEKK